MPSFDSFLHNETQRRYVIDHVIPVMELAMAKTPALFHDWFIDLLAWSCKHNPTFNAAKDLFTLIDQHGLASAVEIVYAEQGAIQPYDGVRQHAGTPASLEQEMPGYSRIQLTDWFREFMRDNRELLLNITQWRQLPEDVQILAVKHLGGQCEVRDVLALLDDSQLAVRWWAAYHLAIVDKLQKRPYPVVERGRIRAYFDKDSNIKCPNDPLSLLTVEQRRRMWCQIQCNMIEVMRSLHQPTAVWRLPSYIQASKILIESAERTAQDLCEEDTTAEIVRKWRGILLSTETDKGEAEKVLLEWYKFWQCPPPAEIIWCQSPIEGVRAAIKRFKKIPNTDEDSHIFIQLYGVLEALGIGAFMMFRTRLSTLTKELVSPCWESLRNASWLDEFSGIFDRILSICFDEIGPTAAQSFRLHALSAPDANYLHPIVRNTCFGGQLEWQCLLALEALRSKGGQFPFYEILAGAAQHCGFWWAFSDCLIVTEKPQIISFDAQDRLHSLSGPALRYSDGWSAYRINGIEVPPLVVLEPERISIDMIEREPNVEVRRICIDRYGPQRFMQDCKAHAIHTSEKGVLYRKEIEDDEPIVMVKVINATPEPDGSRKEYFLRVPPYVTSVEQAIAWTFGMEAQDYKPVIET